MTPKTYWRFFCLMMAITMGLIGHALWGVPDARYIYYPLFVFFTWATIWGAPRERKR